MGNIVMISYKIRLVTLFWPLGRHFLLTWYLTSIWFSVYYMPQTLPSCWDAIAWYNDGIMEIFFSSATFSSESIESMFFSVLFFAIPYEIFQEKSYSDILPKVTILIYQFGDIKKFLDSECRFWKYINKYTAFLYKVPNFEADLNVLN